MWGSPSTSDSFSQISKRQFWGIPRRQSHSDMKFEANPEIDVIGNDGQMVVSQFLSNLKRIQINANPQEQRQQSWPRTRWNLDFSWVLRVDTTNINERVGVGGVTWQNLVPVGHGKLVNEIPDPWLVDNVLVWSRMVQCYCRWPIRI